MNIALYSITYLGIFYNGPALTWKEVLHRAKKFGYDGVEFDAKRPHANPMDWDARTRRAVRAEAERLGLKLPAVAANNDFSSPVPEHREAQILMVREQICLAADLGAPVLRVFAAWPGITIRDGVAQYEEASKAWEGAFPGVPDRTRMNLVVECLREVVRYAERHGVVLALQNHVPVTRTWRDVLQIIRAVDSPWLRACWDLQAHEQDPASIAVGAAEIGPLSVHHHFPGEWRREADGRLVKIYGYERTEDFVRALAGCDYDRWLAYELCHPVLDAKGVVQGIEYVDRMAELACEYMRRFVSDLAPAVRRAGSRSKEGRR